MEMQNILKCIGTLIFIGFIIPSFAESAPVYDAEAMQQQFDNDAEQIQQDFSPQTQEGTFVPVQQSSNMPNGPLSIDQRMRRIEQQITNMVNSDMISRLEGLQNQVQLLRGQVEQLTFQLQQVKDLQKSMYSDLDKRLSDPGSKSKPTIAKSARKDAAKDASAPEVLASNDEEGVPLTQLNKSNDKTPKIAQKTKEEEEKTPTKQSVDNDTDDPIHGAANNGTTAEQPDIAQEQQIYQTAYNLIKSKKYDEAAKTLESMLTKYPSGQFASNAHYWLGELYGLMGKEDHALDEFKTVVRNYPNSPRVSDAQLKVGLIYISQLKWVDAKSAFRKVIKHYPGTASARLALEQLRQIRQAGH